MPDTGGNAWGIKENEILATGCDYILIGNVAVHGRKKILAQPHREFRPCPSCAAAPFIRIWTGSWVWNGELRLSPP